MWLFLLICLGLGLSTCPLYVSQLQIIASISQYPNVQDVIVDSSLDVLYFSVPNQGVYAFSNNTATLLIPIASCPSPTSLALFNDFLYVACGSASVMLFQFTRSTNTGHPIATSSDCAFASKMQVHQVEGTLYVACNSPQVLALSQTNVKTSLLASAPCSGVYAMSLNSVTNILYVSCNSQLELYSFNITTPYAIIATLSTTNYVVYDPYTNEVGVSFCPLYNTIQSGLYQLDTSFHLTLVPQSGQAVASQARLMAEDVQTGLFFIANTNGIYALEGTTWFLLASSSQCKSPSKLIVNSQTGVLYMICGANSLGSLLSSGCVAGAYQSGLTCLYCPPGSFCPTTNVADETPCPPGSFCPLGSFEPTPCSPGSFCPPLSFQPTPCPVSTFCPTSSLSQPQNCTAGSYCSKQGLLEPDFMCQAGTYCPPGSFQPSFCVPGYYCPRSNLSSPVPCAPGTYGPFSQAQNPGLACPSGSYCPDVALSYPGFLCPPGSFCVLGSVHPSPCPLGAISSLGSSQCNLCSVGFIVANASCMPCDNGYVAYNASLCIVCPAGFFCPPGITFVNKPSCADVSIICPQGSFRPQLVPDGFYATNCSATNACTNMAPCEIGFACTQGRRLSCLTGTFSNSSQSSQCTPCEAGYEGNTLGQASHCVPCRQGFMNALPSASCSPCSPGSVASLQASLSCTACLPGSYFPGPGGVQCIPCELNAVTNNMGSPGCTTCGPDTSSNSNHTSCIVTPCAPGQQYVNQSCGPCPPYTYNAGKNVLCQPCPPNSYTPAYGSSQCLACQDAGFSCPQGVAVLNPNYWGFLLLEQGVIVQNTFPCGTGFCEGGAILEMTGPVAGQEGLEEGMPIPFALYQSQDGTALCQNNRDPSPNNYLCGACMDGYTEWKGACLQCPAFRGDIFIEYLVLSCIFVFFLYRVSQRARSDTKIFLYFIQVTLFQLGNESNDTLFSWLHFLNFDLFQTSGSSCIGPVTAYQYLALSACLPLFFIVDLGLFMGIHGVWRHLKYQPHSCLNRYFLKGAWFKRAVAFLGSFWSDVGPDRNPDPGNQDPVINVGFPFHKYTRTLLSILCFGYLQTTASCISFLHCVDVDGQNVVFSAPSIDCSSETYKSWRVVVGAILVLEVVTLPLGMALWLYVFRHRLREEAILSKVGVLYENYVAPSFFWQVWVLVRQIVLVAIGTGFLTSHDTQYIGFVYFHLLVLGLHLYKRPNARPLENTIEVASHVCQLFMMVVLVPVAPPYDESRKIFISCLFYAFTSLLFSYMVLVRVATSRGKALRKWLGIEEPGSRDSIARYKADQMLGSSVQLG